MAQGRDQLQAVTATVMNVKANFDDVYLNGVLCI